MVMGELAESVQVLVIGAGPGGYVAAIRLAQLGKQVVLVEKDGRDGYGGVCLHHGCIPSKAMIYASELYWKASHSGEMGISAKAELDAKKLQEWKNGVVKKLTDGLEFLFKKHGITVVKGEAFFEASNRVGVKTREGLKYFEFQKAIIATGSRATELQELKFDHKTILSSRDALAFEEIPKETIILGAGYIAVEMATMLARLGSKVTIVHRSERMLRGFDADLVEVVRKRMLELGITMHFNAEIIEAKVEGGKVRIKAKLKESGKEILLEAEKCIVAIGRVPNTDKLELRNTRVQLDEKGFVKTNDQRQTNDQNIYCVGDCAGNQLLAHKAFREGKICAEAIAGKKSAFDNRVVPMVVFSEPEIAVVGMSWEEAKARGIKITVGKFPFSALGRAIANNELNGFVKVIANAENGIVLGAGIVCADASNLISEAALGIEMGATLEDFASTIHPHPSFSEGIMESFEDALGKSIHLWKERKG
ncbi:MAG: dihydrolipoyl dehydrogenase [archaeon]